ncbi:hypothetical protein MMC28_007362 [Mycoblastus sanguinarius]|nr:hypothetical protein [Mycoblastus sanguinarius]
MDPNSTQIFDPHQCRSHALFLSDIDTETATSLWTFFTAILQPILGGVTAIVAQQVMIARKALPARFEEDVIFGKVEQRFLASTVMLGLNIFLYFALGLLIQLQRLCGSIDNRVTEGVYIGEWVATIIVSGGVLGTTALLCFNTILCVRKSPKAWPWYAFLKIEACVVFSPFILIGICIVLLAKGPDSWTKSEILMPLRRSRALRRSQTSTQDINVINSDTAGQSGYIHPPQPDHPFAQGGEAGNWS